MVTGHSLEGEFYDYLRTHDHCSREWNQEVLGFYVPYFASCKRILDVGCGEGQFIAMMAARGIQAMGVDADARMVATCRQQGLDVIEADLFEYLSHCSERFDGVFCSNVIEHLSSEDAIRLVRVAFDALQPGGLLLVATPNPESPIVHMHEFWRDATHVRPYNRSLLGFLFHHAGFQHVISAENPQTAWTPPVTEVPQWVAALGSPGEMEPGGGPRSASPPVLRAAVAGGSIWNPPVLQQGRAGWGKLVFSLRRWLASLVARTVLFEEASYIETRLNHMERRLGAIETRWTDIETRWTELMSRPREIFAVGIRPGGVTNKEDIERTAPLPQEADLGRATDEAARPAMEGTVTPVPGRHPPLHIAFFTPYLPYPLNGGGKIRSYYLLRALTARYDVDLYTTYYGDGPPDGMEELAQFCRQITAFQLTKSWRTRDRLVRVFKRLPRSAEYFYDETSLQRARAKLQSGRYDLLISDEICMTPYAELVYDIPRIVIRHKVDHIHYAGTARARPWGIAKVLDYIESVKLEQYGRAKMPLFQAFLACSADDAAAIHRHGENVPALVIPNGADLSMFTPPAQPQRDAQTLLYTGSMDYYPNVDAMKFFFETTYEHIRERVPNVRMQIVGRSPTQEIQQMAGVPGVQVTDSVPDVRPYYGKATAFVVPLRLGSGTRLKIIEAMAMGLPVVSTTVGAEGLDIHPGQDILIANDPDSFADAAVRLVQDADLRRRIAQGGQSLAQRYDWTELTKPFADLAAKVVSEWQQAPRPKRIAFLMNLYPPYVVGGNEMLTRDIAEELLARGHDVHILTARGRELDPVPYIHQLFNYSLDEKDAIFLGARRLSAAELFRHHVFDPVTYRNVRRAIRVLKPDLVVAGNLYMASAAPLLAVRDASSPVAAQVADKWLLFNLVDWGLAIHPKTRSQKLAVEAVKTLVQRPMARFVRLDGIVTVSDFIRQLYIDAGLAPQKLETMYLGIHTQTFKPGAPHPLHDPVRLIFAGALWEGKGPQVIVEAMRLLAQIDGLPRVHLDLFGEGADSFKEYLREVIRSNGVDDQVEFRGFVPWEQLVRAMQEADIFVFPSIWDEPFAITPLQAAACGLPVIATRAGGTPEGFVDGETALLIPPNDAQAMAHAIERLVRDVALRTRLRDDGLQAVERRWSFEAYVDRLLAFYQRVGERWSAAQ